MGKSKRSKRQIIHHLKKRMNKDVFSLEEKNIIKKRIVQINKITKNNLNYKVYLAGDLEQIGKTKLKS
jgi:hypothetical protein